MRTSTLLLAAAAVAASATMATTVALAEPPSLIGAWRLTAVYDEFTDGRRRETWGADPRGILMISPGGAMSVQIIGADRPAKPGSTPAEPVGPAVAYFGTWALEADGKGLTFKVERSTWPQWNGAALKRTATVSETTLEVVAAPIKDPAGGEFQPHLTFERIK
jgi:hypothetical protein